MKLSKRGGYRNLIKTLERSKQIPQRGSQWVSDSANTFNNLVEQNLADQGRSGSPPPLSSATRKIYEIDTDKPDGSGITEHITLEYRWRKTYTLAIVGIPNGDPTMIAKVQDQGATIQVTEKMRGFLAAAYGIRLRSDTTHINIPGRHFWEQSIRQGRKIAKNRVKLILYR